MDRQISTDEMQLIRWMLENGNTEAKEFLSQVEALKATDWRCPCGCASINFSVNPISQQQGGIHILGDFLFGAEQELSGIFVFEQGGVLAGLEVYGMAGRAPETLPSPNQLRSFDEKASLTSDQ